MPFLLKNIGNWVCTYWEQMTSPIKNIKKFHLLTRFYKHNISKHFQLITFWFWVKFPQFRLNFLNFAQVSYKNWSIHHVSIRFRWNHTWFCVWALTNPISIKKYRKLHFVPNINKWHLPLKILKNFIC